MREWPGSAALFSEPELEAKTVTAESTISAIPLALEEQSTAHGHLQTVDRTPNEQEMELLLEDESEKDETLAAAKKRVCGEAERINIVRVERERRGGRREKSYYL